MSSVNTGIEKKNRSSGFISIISLAISIIAVAFTCLTFFLDKSNYPLVIQYQNCELTSAVANENNEHNPDSKDYKLMSTDNGNLLRVYFKRTQGEVSRIYKVDFSSSSELIYTEISFNKFDKGIFYVPVLLSEEKNVVEDTNAIGEVTSSFEAPRLQRFALALVDYKDNLYVYYIVLRPIPDLNQAENSYTINYNSKNEVDIQINNITKWEYEVAFIDCSITNSLSLKQAVIKRFNNSYGHFQYDDVRQQYMSSFPVLTKEQKAEMSTKNRIINPKYLVVHDTLDIEGDAKLIKSIPNDKLI